MAKITKNVVDKNLRERIFDDLMGVTPGGFDYDYQKINDRQYGTIITDLNGEKRYVRIGVIVAEIRDDMTAEELMKAEIDAYKAAQDKKAEKAKEKAAAIAAQNAEKDDKN